MDSTSSASNPKPTIPSVVESQENFTEKEKRLFGSYMEFNQLVGIDHPIEPSNDGCKHHVNQPSAIVDNISLSDMISQPYKPRPTSITKYNRETFCLTEFRKSCNINPVTLMEVHTKGIDAELLYDQEYQKIIKEVNNEITKRVITGTEEKDGIDGLLTLLGNKIPLDGSNVHDVLKDANAHPSWHTTKLPIFSTLIALPRSPWYFHWLYDPHYWNNMDLSYKKASDTTKIILDYKHVANFMHINKLRHNGLTLNCYGQLGYCIGDYNKIHYFINVPNDGMYNLEDKIDDISDTTDIKKINKFRVNVQDSKSAHQKIFNPRSGVLRQAGIRNSKLDIGNGGSHILYAHPLVLAYIRDESDKDMNLPNNNPANSPSLNSNYFARKVSEIPIDYTVRKH